ncbi:hypothetical protein [Saccharopolyspora sp. NPDC002376]
MTHVNLVNVQRVPGGVSVPSVTMTVRGISYNLPSPQSQVTGAVFVHPVAEADEDSNSIRIRFDLWQATCDLGHRFQSLPLNFPDMASAVRGARQFDADPGIDWDSHSEDLEMWAVAFVERERAQQGGGQ